MIRTELDGGMKAEILPGVIVHSLARKGTPATRKRAIRARRSRAKLLAEMGSHCWHCGSQESLCFHHVYEPTWWPARKSYQARQSEYWRAWRAGELALMCRDCHESLTPWVREQMKEHAANIAEIRWRNLPF